MKNLKKYAKVIILLTVIILLVCFSFYEISKSRNFQFFGGLTSHVNTEEKIVALTFDDAPTEYTNEILEILDDKNVKATFFVVGKIFEKYPLEGEAIIENGHEIGNHSYSHQRFIFKSQTFIESEIEKTNKLIHNHGYKGEITLRPPNGKKFFGLPYYLSQNNIKTIMWDVEPDTYVSGDADAIVKYTVEHTKPGSIILLHPFNGTAGEADREALPKIIDELKASGYSFVTISQLLKYKN